MDTLELLRRVPIFSNLTDADLTLVAKIVRRYRVPAGATICRQSRPGDVLYIIESGDVETWHVDKNKRRHDMGAKRTGDCLGDGTFLSAEPNKISARAVSDVELSKILLYDFNTLLNAQPSLRKRISAAKTQVSSAPVAGASRSRAKLDWLMEDEEPVMIAKKHWWALVQEMAKPFGVLLLFYALAIVMTVFQAGNFILIAIVWAIVFLFTSVGLMLFIIDWRNDVYAVTTKRVLHLERVLGIREERREAPLDKVQNVQLAPQTWVRQAVGVSDVLINTAAVYGTIVFANVNEGEKVRAKIFEQLGRVQTLRQVSTFETYKERVHKKIDGTPESAGNQSQMAAKSVAPRLSWLQQFRNRFRFQVAVGETITWRKHWIALLRQCLRPALVALVIWILFAYIAYQANPELFILIPSALLAFLLPFSWVLWEYIDWSNDIYQLTNDRVIDVERNALGVIQRSVESPLSAVQNVSYRQPNILWVFFGIGDVIVETAGATGQMVFQWMSPPAQVANTILTRVEQIKNRARQAESDRAHSDTLQWLDAYHSYLEDEEQLRGAPPRPADAPPMPGADDPPPAQ